jgi:hypothetical protein
MRAPTSNRSAWRSTRTGWRWRRFGYVPKELPGMAQRLADYGPDAAYMERFLA